MKSFQAVARIGALLLAAALALPASAAQKIASHHITVELLSEPTSIVPGNEFWVGIHFVMDKEWHVYWTNPGDSGEPPRVEWELPAGFTAGSLQWPAPRRITIWQFVDYGYEDELLLMAQIKVPASASGSAPFGAKVRWAVCREVCIADRARLDLELPVGKSAQSGPNRAIFEIARKNIPKPAPRSWKVSALSTKDAFVLSLRSASARLPVQPGIEPVFFPAEKSQIENAAPQKFSRSGNTARFTLKKAEQLLKAPPRLKGIVSFGPAHAYSVDAPVAQRE